MTDIIFPLQAALLVGKDRAVDDILDAVARTMRSEGRNAIGFLQRQNMQEGECCGQIELEDIATGTRHVISQALGSGARGCRLDPQALAGIAGLLLTRVEAGPDLLILNRFGKGEAEGGGFRAVIEAACMRGIPTLTAVREDYVEAWRAFSGDLGVLIAPDRGAAIGWARRAISGSPEIDILAIEEGGDQIILRAEMAVETGLCDTRSLHDEIDADGV